MDLLDAQRERQARVDLAVAEPDAHRLGLLLDGVVADRRDRLDGRDVEREPQGVADADGAALEVVGVGGRVAVPEVGDDVHEHRRRR